MPDNPTRYLDFDLEIGPGAGRAYPVSVLHSPAGEARTVMQFPFDELMLENNLLKLQTALLRSGGGRRSVLDPHQQAVQDFGRALFEALFNGEVRSRYDVSRLQADHAGQGLRLKLHIRPPELAVLPWEYLFDVRMGDYLCLSSSTPVVRYPELPQAMQPLRVSPPLRILGLIADPTDMERLDVTKEKERVALALARLRTGGQVELTWLSGSTARDLQRALRGGPWHIVHFVGHGGFDRPSDEGLVVLTDNAGRAQPLFATPLARLLGDHRALRLVVLNACEGARGSERDIFASAAAILVRRGIPAVLAMQHEITDHAAVEFARAFYEAVADGYPVDAAVSEGRKAVSTQVPNTVEWGTPVLTMRASDGALFDITELVAHEARQPELKRQQEAAEREQQERAAYAAQQAALKRQQEAAERERQVRAAVTTQPEVSSDSIQSQPHALETAKRAPEILEQQAAGFTSLTIPAHLKIELEDKRQEIAELKDGSKPAIQASDKAKPEQAEEPQQPVTPTPTLSPTPRERGLPAWALIGIGVVAVVLLLWGIGALDARSKPTPTVVTGPATETLTASSTPTNTPEPTDTPAPAAGATRVRDIDRAVMVWVPAGEFTMGSTDSDSQAESDEKPQHKVTLDGFWIDRTEVTNAQYRKFVDAGVYSKQEYWTEAGWAWKESNKVTQSNCWGNSHFNQAEQPIVCVSWYEASAYAHWVGGRLPTEAEWEKAARGSSTSSGNVWLYPWGNTWDGMRVNFCDQQCEYSWKDANVNDGYGTTAPVGSYANGVSPYGVLDLAGNVWEWVSSKYGNYPYRSDDGREDQSSTEVRVLRGGSWNNGAGHVRSADRYRLGPDNRNGSIGFRVASPGL